MGSPLWAEIFERRIEKEIDMKEIIDSGDFQSELESFRNQQPDNRRRHAMDNFLRFGADKVFESSNIQRTIGQNISTRIRQSSDVTEIETLTGKGEELGVIERRIVGRARQIRETQLARQERAETLTEEDIRFYRIKSRGRLQRQFDLTDEQTSELGERFELL